MGQVSLRKVWSAENDRMSYSFPYVKLVLLIMVRLVQCDMDCLNSTLFAYFEDARKVCLKQKEGEG